MKKSLAILAVIISFSSLILGVAAQTPDNSTITDAPTVTPQPEPNYFGGAAAIVALAIVFAIILFAGYKIIRKWTGPSSD